MRSVLLIAAGLALAFGASACQSSQKGVKSNYRSQWTTVGADVKATTAAAEAILRDADLRDVKSSSTSLDGKASGKKADGTKIDVAIQKDKETTSQVSVTVGTLGDPSLGADFARRIKDRAEKSAGGVAASTTRP
jgi:hypothetical protein